MRGSSDTREEVWRIPDQNEGAGNEYSTAMGGLERRLLCPQIAAGSPVNRHKSDI